MGKGGMSMKRWAVVRSGDELKLTLTIVNGTELSKSKRQPPLSWYNILSYPGSPLVLTAQVIGQCHGAPPRLGYMLSLHQLQKAFPTPSVFSPLSRPGQGRPLFLGNPFPIS